LADTIWYSVRRTPAQPSPAQPSPAQPSPAQPSPAQDMSQGGTDALTLASHFGTWDSLRIAFEIVHVALGTMGRTWHKITLPVFACSSMRMYLVDLDGYTTRSLYVHVVKLSRPAVGCSFSPGARRCLNRIFGHAAFPFRFRSCFRRSLMNNGVKNLPVLGDQGGSCIPRSDAEFRNRIRTRSYTEIDDCLESECMVGLAM